MIIYVPEQLHLKCGTSQALWNYSCPVDHSVQTGVAAVNEKLEPKLWDTRNRRINVMCINTYPASLRTSKVSRLSASKVRNIMVGPYLWDTRENYTVMTLVRSQNQTIRALFQVLKARADALLMCTQGGLLALQCIWLEAQMFEGVCDCQTQVSHPGYLFLELLASFLQLAT